MQVVHVNGLKPFISYDNRPDTVGSTDIVAGDNNNKNDQTLQENLLDEDQKKKMTHKLTQQNRK